MSGTIIGSNTTIKVHTTAIAASDTGSGGATMYTAPANGYAIINYYGSGTSLVLKVGGKRVNLGSSTEIQQIYVGPSQAVVATGTSIDVQISGVEFRNSP